MPPPKTFRVIVCGAGSISREFSLNHFGPGTQTEVVGLVDVDADKARELAIDIGAMQAGAKVTHNKGSYRATTIERVGQPVPYATTLDQAMLDSGDIVYIGTTPDSHAELVSTAVGAGKSVLLEKPVASRKVDADSIVAACQAAWE
eukprot:gene8817-7997_t